LFLGAFCIWRWGSKWRESIKENRFVSCDFASIGLEKEINPLLKETIFTYDDGGNRVTKLDPNNNTIQYTYDSRRRLTDILYPDMTGTHFDYDDRGNKTYEENQSSQKSYEYDELGRVTSVTDELLSKTITYEYDQNGNRSKMIGPDGEETVYHYDALNRLTELIDPENAKTIFKYDKSGKRTSLKFPNGVQGSYFYDLANHLESVVYKNTSGDVIQSFTYTHDNIGNRTSKMFASGNSENYGYDDLHRLTSATYPSGRSVVYDYDPVGNRNFLTESWDGGGSETTNYTYSDFNQVLSTTNSGGTTTYGWDDNGNLISKQNPALEVTGYDYNFENRMIGINYNGGSTNSFGYDPQGIRTFKEDSEGRHDYLIDKASVLAEFDGTGTKKAWFNHNPQRIDEIVSQVQSSGKFFHLVDGLGSVTGLVDSGQVKVAAYTYDAYGALTDSQVQPGVQNPFLFTGREVDADSGLQYNRARYYLNGVGSWNREDPFNQREMGWNIFENSTLGSLVGLMSVSGLELPQVFNRYSYSYSRPVSLFDPLGHFGVIAGLLIAVGIALVIVIATLVVALTIHSLSTGKIPNEAVLIGWIMVIAAALTALIMMLVFPLLAFSILAMLAISPVIAIAVYIVFCIAVMIKRGFVGRMGAVCARNIGNFWKTKDPCEFVKPGWMQ